MDYRYVPEPDILPIVLEDNFIEECRAQIVEAPIEKRIRYLNEYKLWDDDARILTADYDLCLYFEELVSLTQDPKKSCSYITSVLLWLINESAQDTNINNLQFDISQLASVIHLINNDELSSTNAKQVIEILFETGWSADEIVDKNNLRQKNDMCALEEIVKNVIAWNPQQIEDYKSGNERIFWFLVGQCMKASKGQWNPKVFTKILQEKLV